MATEVSKMNPYPEDNANLLSKAFFQWVNPLVILGNKKVLDMDDLPDCSKHDKSEVLYSTFIEKNKGKIDRNIMFKFMEVSKMTLIVGMIAAFINACCQLAQPIILRYLILSINENDPLGWRWGLYLWISGVIGGFSNQIHLHSMYQSALRFRATAIALVYRHAIELNISAKIGVSDGELSNMISTDAQKLYDVMPQVNLIWIAPFQVIVAMYFLIDYLGLIALAGCGIMLLLVPLNHYMGKYNTSIRQKLMPLSDARVKLCSEVFSGIRVIKYFNWEQKFKDLIMKLRVEELFWAKKELLMFAFSIFLMIVFPILGMVATFTSYVLTGNVITAANAFSALAFFNIMRFPLNQLGVAVIGFIQARIGLSRLQGLLSIKATFRPPLKKSDIKNNIVIKCEEAYFSWFAPQSFQTDIKGDAHLKNVSFELKEKDLMLVVGPVGGAKSTFVNGLLGEIELISGISEVYGRIAFVPQEAWILNATVRDNILFGLEYDEDLYYTVLDAVVLTPDLERFDDKDFTIIGEKGLTLSGGQKQRVSIGRALYAVLKGASDIVIMDDPLSALDSETGKKVFDALLSSNGLMKNVTKVLVTHALQYVNAANLLMVLSSGKCIFVGHPDNLANTVSSFKESSNISNEDLATLESLLVSQDQVISQEEISLNISKNLGREGMKSAHHLLSLKDTKSLRKSENQESKKLMTEEGSSSTTKTVSFDVVKQYFLVAGGGSFFFFWSLIVLLIIERCFYAGSDLWLAVWTSAVSGYVPYPWLPVSGDISGFYVGVYVGVSVLACVFAYWRTIHIALGGALASKILFSDLLDAMIRSPVAFFETTPHGRILSRVSYDVQSIDYTLVTRLNATIASSFWILSSIIVMIAVVPTISILLLVVCVLYYFLQLYYRIACIQIQRLDSVSRSPIQNFIQESIAGTSSIRAYQASKRFITTEDSHVDNNNRALSIYTATNRWLGIRLELMGSFVTLLCAILCWWYRASISGGLAGFALLWSFNFTISLNFQVMFSTDAEAKLNAVERLVEWANLPPEAPLVNDVVVDKSWPRNGEVSFKDVVFKYRPDLPAALRKLTFTIKGGSRVGVVGRTGSGKSTLAVALFRIAEIESGEICIDDVCLKRIGLSDVRGRSLCIIPQDPVLFTGNMRTNLDPFNEKTDFELFEALRKVQLGSDIVPSLDMIVEQGGKNWSVGQRQLLCLARALLRQPKVLILDEATASIDTDTDNILQETIKSCFLDCTMIIIAHRLYTIMNADAVLVMHDGEAVEAGSPLKLLSNSSSFFTKLVDSTGEVSSQALKNIAINESKSRAINENAVILEAKDFNPESSNDKLVAVI